MSEHDEGNRAVATMRAVEAYRAMTPEQKRGYDEDAVDGLSLSETEARLLRAYFEASRGYTVSGRVWERMKDDFTDLRSMAGEQRRRDMVNVNAVLAALKSGDRLPGVDEHGKPITLVVVPETPTWAMEQASLTAPMPPHSNRATKKKRHENLVAKIHARWSAMLAAAAKDIDR